jgi:hypothetical protein
MAYPDQITYDETFPEHDYGLPADITQRTHEYGLGSIQGWDRRGKISSSIPKHYSSNPKKYPWIIPKTRE